jgi:TetR/AcrR family transcriptional repressor of nem operon
MKRIMEQQNNTRSQILTTGRRLTAQQGYTGVGLSSLLKEAGVPKGSFYHYFPSKEAYGCALLEEFMTEYGTRLNSSRTLSFPAVARSAIPHSFWDLMNNTL